jgi:hypothetical protein
VDIPDPKPQTVSPLRITKKSDKKQWQVSGLYYTCKLIPNSDVTNEKWGVSLSGCLSNAFLLLFLLFSHILYAIHLYRLKKSASNDKGATGFLDPERISGKQYELVSRDDSKLCPKSLQRCEQCRVSFNQADKVLVKSVGIRERTHKAGKVVTYSGNVYFHFLTKCLREYNHKFA